jgi:hypothetical protein
LTTYGEEMGRNEITIFVCNESRWGDLGRNRVSPLEMGTEGRGRGTRHPYATVRLKIGGLQK